MMNKALTSKLKNVSEGQTKFPDLKSELKTFGMSGLELALIFKDLKKHFLL